MRVLQGVDAIESGVFGFLGNALRFAQVVIGNLIENAH
jgi:hypothetical protein